MAVPIASAPLEILLVEDNPADVRLTTEALNATQVRHQLHVARDGVEAMQMLRGAAGSRAIRPDLVLLDLNLPRKDGREVLQELKEDDALRHIPVVILTTSQADQDIQQSYRLHANAFVTKPVDLDQFFEVVRSLEHFWLETAKLSRP
jgi:chemotaxis family two-component system response regulator Rcp1